MKKRIKKKDKNEELSECSENETITIDNKSEDSNETSFDGNSSDVSNTNYSLDNEKHDNSNSSKLNSKPSSNHKSIRKQTAYKNFYVHNNNNCTSKYPCGQNISEYMAEYVEKKIDDFDNENIPINLNSRDKNLIPIVLDRIPINSNYQNYSVYPEWWGYYEPNQNESRRNITKKNYRRRMVDESIQVTLSGHSYVKSDLYGQQSNTEKNKQEKTKVEYFKCNKSPSKNPWKPQSTQTDDLTYSDDDDDDDTYSIRNNNENINRLSNHPRIDSTPPRYPKKKSEFFIIPFFDNGSPTHSKPPLSKKFQASNLSHSPTKVVQSNTIKKFIKIK